MTNAHIEDVRSIAAFADGGAGGNPAGVLITDALLPDDQMQAIAARVGYSETAFAAPEGDRWRVRYFAPDCEVDFCGHATVALGAVLADTRGAGRYPLTINAGEISVASALDDSGQIRIELTSPPTKSGPANAALQQAALRLFGLDPEDLDPRLPPAIANAGNNHLVLTLTRRETLAKMGYDLDAGRALMERHGLTTINLLNIETPQLFHARNAFAIGGVAEDPATGAAAAALAGYLRDLDWPHGGRVEIRQGADMGMPSVLRVGIPAEPGTPVLVSGHFRDIG